MSVSVSVRRGRHAGGKKYESLRVTRWLGDAARSGVGYRVASATRCIFEVEVRARVASRGKASNDSYSEYSDSDTARPRP